MSNESKSKMSRQTIILVLALVATILSAIAISRAWFAQNKGLQTMTKIQFASLYLKGKDSDTVSVELGKIDVRSNGEKRIPFRVVASENAKFKLQLGYTTNLPLEYKIIKVNEWGSNDEWKNAEVTNENTIKGTYLNKNENDIVANSEKHDKTYGKYEMRYVQTNAEPVYWQSETISRTEQEHRYILIVNWKECNNTVTDKDTDMIYLTAGIVEGTNEAN